MKSSVCTLHSPALNPFHLPSLLHTHTTVRYATHGSLQHTATHGNILHRTATTHGALQHTATHCNTLQHNILQRMARCNTLQHNVTQLQHATTHCNILQHTASCNTRHATTHCNTLHHNMLQHAAAHCNILQHTICCNTWYATTHCNTLHHNTLQHTVIHCNTLPHTFRKRKWWTSGDNELAEYDSKVDVWVSDKHNISQESLDDLETALSSREAKDDPHNGTEGVEAKYWTGTEAGLMGIPHFPGLIYATDGSQEKGNMGAGFYNHEGEKGGFCKVGRSEEGASSNRAEHAAACIALEDVAHTRHRGAHRPN